MPVRNDETVTAEAASSMVVDIVSAKHRYPHS
jgi:hypothetical protein